MDATGIKLFAGPHKIHKRTAKKNQISKIFIRLVTQTNNYGSILCLPLIDKLD